MTKGRGSGKTPERVIQRLQKAVSESSQTAVAQATGIGVAAINRYLRGIGEPSSETLQKLADHFGVSSIEWLRGSGLNRIQAHDYEIFHNIIGLVKKNYSDIHAQNTASILQLTEDENYKLADFIRNNFT